MGLRQELLAHSRVELPAMAVAPPLCPNLQGREQQETPNLLPDIKNTPFGSTARQVTASRWATMECTGLPGGRTESGRESPQLLVLSGKLRDWGRECECL